MIGDFSFTFPKTVRGELSADLMEQFVFDGSIPLGRTFSFLSLLKNISLTAKLVKVLPESSIHLIFVLFMVNPMQLCSSLDDDVLEISSHCCSS